MQKSGHMLLEQSKRIIRFMLLPIHQPGGTTNQFLTCCLIVKVPLFTEPARWWLCSWTYQCPVCMCLCICAYVCLCFFYFYAWCFYHPHPMVWNFPIITGRQNITHGVTPLIFFLFSISPTINDRKREREIIPLITFYEILKSCEQCNFWSIRNYMRLF